MIGQPAPREWPCQICNVPGRTVEHRGDPCDQCREDAKAWEDPGTTSPTVHEILPPRYRDLDDVALVPLGAGRWSNEVRGYALVDGADLAWASSYSWHLTADGYVARMDRSGPRPRVFTMHRELLGLIPGDGVYADHLNGVRVDNRRANLRTCTQHENNQNVRSKRGTSRYRGVSKRNDSATWAANATLNHKRYRLGRYSTEDEAARAVNHFWISHGYTAPDDVPAAVAA